MMRQFSMHTVLRRTPFKMLRWFLPELGIDLPFDWTTLRTKDLPKVITAYDLVPEEQRTAAEATVRDIVSLADQDGIAAIKEAAKISGLSYLDLMFKAYPSAYLKAIWTWTAHRNVFDKAKKLLQVNRLAYFRKREGVPTGQPPLTEEKLAFLKERLQTFFKEKKHCGEKCIIETFDRGEGRFCVVAYPDDLPIPYLEIKQNELTPIMVNPVFEVVFDIDSNAGTLTVSAKFGNAVKEELENLFIRTIYGIEPPQIEKPVYCIGKLKDSAFRLTTEMKDNVKAEVSFVSLKWKGIRAAQTITACEDGSVFRAVKVLLRKEKRKLEDAEIRRAAIRFHFKPMQGRRAGVLCAEVTPADITLRCKDNVRKDIILKYLREWGIQCHQQ